MLFFHDLYDAVPQGDKGTIEKVIAEERRHVRRLAGMIQK
jgi:rubrerythrin